jgi:hypothetical protein
MDVSSVPSVLCVVSYTDIGMKQKFPFCTVLLLHVTSFALNGVEEEMESFGEVIHTMCFFLFTVFSRPVSICCLIIGS